MGGAHSLAGIAGENSPLAGIAGGKQTELLAGTAGERCCFMKTTLSLDARKRLTLPPDAGMNPGDLMDMEVMDDGRIMLTPIVKVPRHQMWAWTEKVDRLLAEAAVDKSPKLRISDPGAMEHMAKILGINS
jgi:hypothetical protein